MRPTSTDTAGRAGRAGRAPIAVLAAGVLAILVAVAAALGGRLNFTGPRWWPNSTTKPAAIIASTPPRAVPTRSALAATVHSAPDLTWVAVVIGSIVLAVACAFLVRWLVARRRDRVDGVASPLIDPNDLTDLPLDPTVETGLPYLRRGLRRALDALGEDRPPRDAIVQAWLGLQEAAEDAGFQRGDSETPTEFTTRILRRVSVDPVALSTLRRLYLAVRFGEAEATRDDVAAARRSLETLQAQWEHDDEAAPTVPAEGAPE